MSEDALVRFLSKIEVTDNCWNWLGSIRTAGGCYGRFNLDGKYKIRYAHRISYELFVGKIPKGLIIDHKCRNTRCVNPTHLEPVTHRENVLRGVSIVAVGWRRNQKKKVPNFDLASTQVFVPSRKNATGANI